jgi:hypothetical protein
METVAALDPAGAGDADGSAVLGAGTHLALLAARFRVRVLDTFSITGVQTGTAHEAAIHTVAVGDESALGHRARLTRVAARVDAHD